MIRAAALVVAVFGLLSIVSGGRVLFGDGAEAAGGYAALGGHIAAGAPYEARTVAAMTVRTALWLAVAGLAWMRLVRR